MPFPAASIIRKSFRELFSKDPLRLAGATAFFTTFALPAILLIILQVARLALTQKERQTGLLDTLTRYVGKEAATHLVKVLGAFKDLSGNWLTMTAGFLFLLFVATTLFKVIKNSLNDLWDIRVVEAQSVWLTMRMRFRELAIIVAAGVLFVTAVLLDGMQTLASDEFIGSSPVFRIILGNTIGFVVSLLLVTCWFGTIFSYLPDGRLPPGNAFMGAFVTALLFNSGKLGLKWLLLYSNLPGVFGNSAAVVLLLLFVFYSSFIFYFGAAFTKVLAAHRGAAVKPLPHARLYRLTPR